MEAVKISLLQECWAERCWEEGRHALLRLEVTSEVWLPFSQGLV